MPMSTIYGVICIWSIRSIAFLVWPIYTGFWNGKDTKGERRMEGKRKWLWGIAYLASILLGNIVVNEFGIVTMAGLTFPAGVVFVGLTFSFRDFVQRYWGDWPTWIWMALASIITVFFNLDLAIASFTAFLISESVDWFVYKVSGLPFYKRIYVSNLFSCPLDSIVFVALAFGWVWPAMWGQAIIKYASGLLVLPFVWPRKERK